MRKTALIIASGVALALAACGSETSGEFTTEDGETAEYTIDKNTGETSMTLEGEDGTATLRSGADVPVDLPDGFSLYPGAKVITNTVVNQPDGTGTMVMFETGDAADKVIAHFRKEAEEAGFAIQIDANMNGSLMIGGERKKDGSTLSVTANTHQGDATTGQLIIGSKKGG
ncbi:hypothetical protein OIK40_07805 [Erythrobacter sp. sf7]|uniref:Uncharacterized protein n=1 Tax=Erythrobacter fulvus TaxID=2987523 RepID=A0ABT5JR23_9SPHN|nr:hypothetical protein [Erythrobacter fulvus]MDC8754541.1 hypothetical protein [Erythrobacter fulvus]